MGPASKVSLRQRGHTVFATDCSLAGLMTIEGNGEAIVVSLDFYFIEELTVLSS
jgi:hypothetical protein